MAENNDSTVNIITLKFIQFGIHKTAFHHLFVKMLLLERMKIPYLTQKTLTCAIRDSSVFFNANCRNELEKF